LALDCPKTVILNVSEGSLPFENDKSVFFAVSGQSLASRFSGEFSAKGESAPGMTSRFVCPPKFQRRRGPESSVRLPAACLPVGRAGGDIFKQTPYFLNSLPIV